MKTNSPIRSNRRQFLRAGSAAAMSCLSLHLMAPRSLLGEEVLPKHVTPETLKSVRAGMDFLARTQGSDGGWHDRDGQHYPVAMSALAGMALLAHGNTPTRGKYAPQLSNAVDYLTSCSTDTGMITGTGQEEGRPMHGHGFALMFLASAYGTVTNESKRTRLKNVIKKGIDLTVKGQSAAGGWTYTPGDGDEGSVTITQVQALRAAHNAGFLVPKGAIEAAAGYIDKCMTPEGGVRYALFSGPEPRLPITAAAVATLYNAGDFDTPAAERCLDYTWLRFKSLNQFSTGDGHDYYTHLYAAQAFYMAGDKYWDVYFPRVRDQLLKLQNTADGSWNGDGIGSTYGTSIALVVLQLPYKYLPVYQR